MPGSGHKQSVFEGIGWTLVVTADEDRRRRLPTREFMLFRRVGELDCRDEEVHYLRLLAPAAAASH